MFLIPISHDENELESFPYLTLGIIGLCLVVLAFQETLTSPRRARHAMNEALEYYSARHTYLNRPYELEQYTDMVGLPLDVILMKRMDVLDTPDNPFEIARQQAMLETMIEEAAEKMMDQVRFYRSFGYVPAEPTWYAPLTCLFIHAGFWHLVGNMLFLYLIGATIEDRYGRVAYAILYLTGGLFSTLMFSVHYPGSMIPLVGASGAVSVLMGTFLVYFAKTRIRFMFLIPILVRFTFHLRAWVVIPTWFFFQVLYGYLSDNMDPTGQMGGVAYWAHVWGFVYGGLTAVALRLTGWDKRFMLQVDKDDDSLLRRAIQRERIGKPHEALEMLRKGISDTEEDDEEALEMLFSLARKLRSDRDLLFAGRRLMRADLDHNEPRKAYMRWKEIVDAVPTARLSAGLYLDLATKLHADEAREEAADVIETLAQSREVLSEAHIRRMLEIAMAIESPVGFAVLDRAESLPDQSEAAHAEWRDCRARLEAALDDGGIEGGIEISAASPTVVEDEVTRAVHALKVFEMLPIGLSRAGIAVRLANGNEKSFPFDQIKVVGAGVIREAGDKKPELIIDLMFDPVQTVLPQHRVLRLRSSGFDPRTLLPNAPSYQAAFSLLVEGILARSGALPLPDREAVIGKPYPVHRSVRAYERATYFPD